jgi:hypothetical protein
MGAARVLHFGEDGCHRLAVLRSVGFYADLCDSSAELEQRIQAGNLDAVLFTELPLRPPELAELHSRVAVPFVFFGDTQANPTTFDLVIEPITSPAVWLERLRRTIDDARRLRRQCAQIRARSEAMQSDSAALRQESEDARRKSVAARRKLTQTQKNFKMGQPEEDSS